MLTAEQLEKRKGKIGSSDAADICGLGYAGEPGAWDAWARITGRVEPWKGNDSTDAGNRLEDAVVAFGFEKLNALGKRFPDIIIPDSPWDFACVNLDASATLAGGEEVIIEAKTGGICSPLDYGSWGDEGSDEVPERYKIQVHHQFAFCGAQYRRAFIPALIPPRGFVMFEIQRDDELVEAIKERERQFYLDHVVADVPPDGLPSLEVAKRLRRTPNKEVWINAALVEELKGAKAMLKDAKEKEETAKAAVIAAMGDAEQGRFVGGIATYFEQRRNGYTVEETTFRQLKIK
jgi:predicted phage-related endonuclease